MHFIIIIVMVIIKICKVPLTGAQLLII